MPGLHLVNEQPPVLLDLSEDELFLVLGSTFIVSTTGSCLLFALIWEWWAGIVIMPIVTTLCTKQAAAFLCRLKRGKPANYYPLLIRQWFDRRLGTGAATYCGPWSIVRRNRFEGGR
ncbi:MAG: DUF3487 family protein [Steroidobacteraceae bacterium]